MPFNFKLVNCCWHYHQEELGKRGLTNTKSVSVKVYRLAWIKYCICWPRYGDSKVKSLDFVKANIIKGFCREERSDKEGGRKVLGKILINPSFTKGGGGGGSSQPLIGFYLINFQQSNPETSNFA